MEMERVLSTKIRGGSCRKEGERSPRGRRFRERWQGSVRGGKGIPKKEERCWEERESEGVEGGPRGVGGEWVGLWEGSLGEGRGD